ncbi:hypothetical protein D3C79_979060 [compost metagenome]
MLGKISSAHEEHDGLLNNRRYRLAVSHQLLLCMLHDASRQYDIAQPYGRQEGLGESAQIYDTVCTIHSLE